MRRCLLPLLILVAATRPLAGQSTVTGVRDLNFGVVIRGVPAAVAPGDPIRSGRFYVRDQQHQQVQVNFTLPTTLTRTGGGGTMPITFGASDATADGAASNGKIIVFDPRKQKVFALVGGPDFYLNLGGQVSPAANQAAGSYTGTVVLVCNFF